MTLVQNTDCIRAPRPRSYPLGEQPQERVSVLVGCNFGSGPPTTCPEPTLRRARGVATVFTGGGQEAQGVSVFAAGSLPDESAGDRVARADTSSHCTTGCHVPSARREVVDCGFQPSFRLRQLSAGVGGGDRVATAPAWGHCRRSTRSPISRPASTTASRRTPSQKSRPTLALRPAFRRNSSRL